MKRLLIITFLTFLIFQGLSALLFVLRMLWFPPSMMGMMMGRQMMSHHMIYWFNQSLWISFILVGVVILFWIIRESKKNDKE